MLAMGILLATLVIGIAVWFLIVSRILTQAEIDELARRQRLRAIDRHFAFRRYQPTMNMDFKKSMPASGRLFEINESIEEFPCIAAGLLKWKKHEWIIFGCSRAGRVIAMWMNKGFSNSAVSPFVNTEELITLANQLGADTILDIHNHPNASHIASKQDQLSASCFGEQFVAYGLSYVAFIAEKGLPYEYACWVTDDFYPLDFYLSQIKVLNGTSRLVNYRLRRQFGVDSVIESHLDQWYASENIGLFPSRQSVERAKQFEKILLEYEKTVADLQAYTERMKVEQSVVEAEPSKQQTESFIPVNSSFLSAVKYNTESGILEVAFKNGSVYRYFDFPESTYQSLLSAPSIGSYYNAHVANLYRYIRIH